MGRKIPKVLTEGEISILTKNFNRRYFSNYKNEMIIKTFLETGLRCQELCDLKWENVNLQVGSLFVEQGKGKKDRIIWFNNNLLNELRKYKIRSFEEIKVEDIIYVFPTMKNNKTQTSHIRRMTNRISVKKIGRAINPHLLRHTYASYLYKHSKNLRMVQKSLGHSSIQTTQIYTHVFDEEMKKEQQRFSLV